MNTKQAISGFSATFLAISLTALASGCSNDPNGSTGGTGGKGGSDAGATGGHGGSGSTTLGPIKGTLVQGFETSASGFILSNYVPTDGETNIGGTSVLSWDSTVGDPSPGSLKIEAPFSDWNQWVEVQAATQMPLLNWTGKKLHVRLKVASGLSEDMYALSGAQALVDTTSTYVQGNFFVQIQPNNQWQEFTLDLSTVTMPGFDASMVITYGLHITSGSGNATAAKPSPAVLYVDSFSIE